MPGLRIHHPTARSVILLVPHPGDPKTGRRPKDYHIHLDAHGDAIVSTTVWGRLVEAEASGLSPHGFIVLNEVADPPTLVMSAAGRAELRPAHVQGSDGAVHDVAMQAVAQKFAPKGVKARITTTKPARGRKPKEG